MPQRSGHHAGDAGHGLKEDHTPQKLGLVDGPKRVAAMHCEMSHEEMSGAKCREHCCSRD